MGNKALAGLSILVADEDVLGGFRTRQHLVLAGARVAVANAAEGLHYLASPHLSAVVVGMLFAGSASAEFLNCLRSSGTPWVLYGREAGAAEASHHVPAGDFRLLESTLQGLCAGRRH